MQQRNEGDVQAMREGRGGEGRGGKEKEEEGMCVMTRPINI